MPEPEPNPAEGQRGLGLLSQPGRDIELFDVWDLWNTFCGNSVISMLL